MPIEIVCPGCSSRLSVADTAAGKTARCPQCESLMTVPALVEGSLVLAPPQPPPADRPSKSRRQRDDDDRPRRRRYEDDEVKTRPRRKKADGSSVGILIGLIAGVLVLVVTGVVIYFTVVKKNDDTADGRRADGGQQAVGLRGVRGAPPPGWIDFEPPDKSYRVFTPGTPFGGSRTQQTGQYTLSASHYQYTSNTLGKCGCQLVTVELSAEVPAHTRAQAKQELEQIATMGVPVISRRTVTWVGQPAVEIECQMGVGGPRPPAGQPQGLYMVHRIVMIDRRCYLFSLIGTGGPPPHADRQTFFDSFEIL